MRFSIQRFDPEHDAAPRMRDYDLDIAPVGNMLLDALLALKARDETLTLRRSCREGVCGSDAMNINGRNGLACITPLTGLREPVEVRPLPGFPIIRDLVVDMEGFTRQYRAVRPWLDNRDPEPEIERLQDPEQRARLDGAIECILCGCCTSACPSFWWHPDKFLGPAALLAAWRFLSDSRDQASDARLDALDDAYKLYRCRSIMSCADVCPKGLNPTAAIGRIRSLLARRKL
jgi:succinate dehydrogenase / fumarate reductase iron-sulfur subunit